MTSQRQQQLRSSTACRRRLDDLYGPILDRMEDGEFSGEGGSDAYDVAIAELKEAYLVTPNLGCMVNEEWDTFCRSHRFDPVAVQDLDEPDEAAAASQQGICIPGSATDVIRLPSGEIDLGAMRKKAEKRLIESIADQNNRSEVAKMIARENMDAKRNRSSAVCRARLEELFKPIKDAKNNDAYKGQEGHTLYLTHMEKAKRDYLRIPNEDLGVMKGTELDKYIEGLNDTGELVKKVDEEETSKATAKRERIVGLLKKVAPQMQRYNETYLKWLNTRIGNINWLQRTAASLDEEEARTNELKDTKEINVAFSGVRIGAVMVSLAIKPGSFDTSIDAGQVVLGSTRISSAVSTKIQRKYQPSECELDAQEEVQTRLLEDQEQLNELMSCIKLLESTRAEIEKELNPRCGEQHQSTHCKEVGELDYVALSALPELDSTTPVLAGRAVKAEVEMDFVRADEVLNAAKKCVEATKSLGGIAVEIGRLSFAWNTRTIHNTDLDEGSKSKTAEKLRKLSMMLTSHMDDVCTLGVEELKKVTTAKEDLKPLLKRHTLTIGNPDMLL